MLSLSHPDQFYQASLGAPVFRWYIIKTVLGLPITRSRCRYVVFDRKTSHRHSHLRLTVGIGTGLTYLPSLGIAAHYFQAKRPLAIGIVSAGASLGAVVHPIMLNKLFYSSLGFHNSVRANAGMNLGLLIIANLLMRTRLPSKGKGAFVPVREFVRDIPYLFAVIG